MKPDLAFRLLRLKISGHPVLKTLDITFCDDKSDVPSIYTTGIIGANGTGKSHLMSAIASVFSDAQKAMDGNKIGDKRFSYTVFYKYLGDTYCLSNIRKSNGFSIYDLYERPNEYLWATCNDEPVELDKVLLPDRVIASTMTISDKFLAKSDDFYRYKGVRNEKSASTTGTRTIIRKTVDSLMHCLADKETFIDELKTLFCNLGLEPHLEIRYNLRYKDLFLRSDIDADTIRAIFENWERYFTFRTTPPWGYNNLVRGLGDDESALEEAARFLSKHARRSCTDVCYDVIADPDEFRGDADALKVLTKLDIVSFPSINVLKRGKEYGLENSSSGETHLLCQFIGIMADIREYSLVLIDEPENSSHPDWQMSYVGWLKEIFKSYPGCHFVIATHSPLILANMKASESTIVRLMRDDKNNIVDEGGMDGGCYSWTIDEILEDVMEMKSNRTSDFNSAISDFERALDEDDKKMAKDAYDRIIPLIRPGNVLAEVLRIQMIGLGGEEDD